ncbi:amino acid permease [Pontibacillus halophilus JSM 076056 = DSM 19796]|uniref:Amino acid permease n=1 Tax=Pontibacillus halophilus JSM 076056 = DSM 19796 TaxID=1385510 RepID=A0A0A5GG83_9BACI|nr:APC family permease [Pontibacillus halophilus]KGX92261.1 amino acid permease [Pontibacillus halophilus JSM 076056 = DSM 19796]
MGENKLNKILSSFDLLVLALGAMLGWGWVVLSGSWIASAGAMGAVVAFIIGGFLVICVGLNYAELSSAMPKVGGEHEYVHRALGYKASFIASWAITLGYISVVTFEAVALPTVIDYLLPDYQAGYLWTVAGWDVHLNWVLIGSVGALIITIINYFGVKQAAVMQTVFTLMIVGVGMMLIFGAGMFGDTKNLAHGFSGGAGGIMTVLVMVPFLFVGFDVIPQVAEEANVPPRKIGRFLILSVVGAIVFYIAVTFGVSLGLSSSQLATSELATADAMANLFGSDLFGNILIIGGVAGIITSWNSFIIGGSRVLYAMAQSGMLPEWFGTLHPKHKTPSNAILFIGSLSMLAPLLGRSALVWIVNAGGLGIVSAYFLVALSFIVLRKREPTLERPFRAGKTPVFGYLALLLSLGFIVLYMPGMSAALVWPYEWLMIAAWTMLGAYFFIRMNRGAYARQMTRVREHYEA